MAWSVSGTWSLEQNKRHLLFAIQRRSGAIGIQILSPSQARGDTTEMEANSQFALKAWSHIIPLTGMYKVEVRWCRGLWDTCES